MKLPIAIFCSFLAIIWRSNGEEDFFRLAGTQQYRPGDNVDFVLKTGIGNGGETPLFASIFRPKNPPAGLMPAVIFIHGGGWVSGSHYSFFGAWLAERGYFVASIDYRLTKTAKWPAQIQDCKLGVRWLRAHAAEFHIDPKRIGVFGTSAGGHLACCVGLIPNIPELEGTGGYADISSEVQAVAAFCPPTDFTGDWVPPKPHPAWVVALFGKPREGNRDLWRQASPLQYVRAGAPPFFIAHGESDFHVPFDQGKRLSEALQDAGAKVEWIPIANASHDFFLNPTTPESAMDPPREVIMQRLLAFFDRYLKQEPGNE